jgi:flagellar biosynthesis/type III secretory pathway protein FliH
MTPPISRVGELDAWITQVTEELDRLQAAVDAEATASPRTDDESALEPELEAAVGRAYLAVSQSRTEIEQRARQDAARIRQEARAEAVKLVNDTTRDLLAVVDEARKTLRALFEEVRSA